MNHHRGFGRIVAAAVTLGTIGAVIGSGLVWTAPAALAETHKQHFAPSPWISDYLRGRVAQLSHDWRTAGDDMRAAWSMDKDNPILRRDALLLTLAGGDNAAAVAMALSIPPNSGDALIATMILIADDFASGRYASAQSRLKQVPSEGNERYLKPLLTAWAELGQGHKSQAQAALEPLMQLPGTGELVALQTALIDEAAGDLPGATVAFDKILQMSPSTRAIEVAAEYFYRRGQTDKARMTIERIDPDGALGSIRAEFLARLADKSPIGATADARRGAASAFFDIAASVADDERVDLTPLLYTHLALKISPDFPQAQILLGQIDGRWGRWAEAAADDLSVAPSSVFRTMAVRAAMMHLAKAGDLDGAAKAGRAGVEAHPEDLDLALEYGDVLRRKEAFAEAVKVYDKMLARMDPANNRRGLTLYHRGISYEELHQWPKAEADLQAALLLRPDDPELLNFLAFSWADQGVNLDRARTMLERAVQLLPEDGAIVDSLGWVLYRQGDYNEAIRQLERAVSLDADSAEVNDHLGDAYWQAGRRIEARGQWERALHASDAKTLEESLKTKLRDGLNESAQHRPAVN